MAIIDANGVDITKVHAERKQTVVADTRTRTEKIQAALQRFKQNAWAINKTRLYEDENKDFKVYGGCAFLRDDGTFQCTTNRTGRDITPYELWLLQYGTGCQLLKHAGNDIFFVLNEDAGKYE